MQHSYKTTRLALTKLQVSDAPFIYELVNTPGWLQFIGDRNIRGESDAIGYINKITSNPAITYWVVTVTEAERPIGVITLIKRSYLAHHDIGFAFLPAYSGQGYAYEAAHTVLHDIIKGGAHTHILATTIKENAASINLLEKLGLRFSHEIEAEGEILHVYAVAVGALLLEGRGK